MNALANKREPGVLEAYAKLKLQLAAMLRALLHTAERRADEMAVRDCRKLLARLAEDRFNLAVLGQFSRGKSSLMNALLGASKLPTGVLPLTSVITTVSYGESERVLLLREGWTFPQEIRLDQLTDYVTQRGNPGNEKKITLAEIQLPHEMLRLGFHFIDTPGIASAIKANTQTTRQFLPEIDAAIVVTSFESPLGAAEMEFLKEVREHARTVFIVVNKQDLVAPDERAQVLDAIREDLKAASAGQFEVFSLSARDALRAKQQGPPENLAASGLPELEHALTSFLRNQKASELLLRAADRAESLARQLTAAGRISERARAPGQAQAFDRRLQEILTEVREQKHALAARLVGALQSFPDECRKRLPLWNAESQATLANEWRRWFSQSDEIGGAAFQDFLRDLSHRFFDEFVSAHRQAMEGIFSGLAEAENPAIERLVKKIGLIPSNVLAEDVRSDRLIPTPLEAAPLAPRQIDVPVEAFQLSCWYDLIPKGWARELVSEHWEKRVPEFVDVYQRSALAVLQSAAGDWVADVVRQLDSRIESTKAQVARLLSRAGEASPAEDADMLDRLADFRKAVREIEAKDPETSLLGGRGSEPRPSGLQRCFICTHLEKILWNFMARAQYELSVSELYQQQHARQSGFCPLHTWQYETIASPQGVCAGYPAVLIRFAEQLRESAQESSSAEALEKRLLSILPRTSSCSACNLLASQEDALAVQIARKASTNDAASPPLCTYHLHSVLEAGPDAEAARRLVLEEAKRLEDLAQEMETYVLKHTSVRHHLTTKTESQAATAGLALLAGSQKLAGPWRID